MLHTFVWILSIIKIILQVRSRKLLNIYSGSRNVCVVFCVEMTKGVERERTCDRTRTQAYNYYKCFPMILSPDLPRYISYLWWELNCSIFVSFFNTLLLGWRGVILRSVMLRLLIVTWSREMSHLLKISIFLQHLLIT